MSPFAFGQTKAVKAGKPVALTADQAAYRERAKAEAARYAKAIEIDLWLCVCFCDEAGLVAWRTEFGFGAAGERVWALDVDWSRWRPDKPRRGFAQQRLEPKRLPPDTWAGLEETDDMEADFRRELEAMRQALVKVSAHPKPDGAALASGIWFVLVFPAMGDKEAWVKQMGLAQFGKKYMDGDAVRRALERNKHGKQNE